MAEEKQPWSKRHTKLPLGQRVVSRLKNEITRLTNTLGTMDHWPNEEHSIGAIKLEIKSAIESLSDAIDLAEEIPEDFSPRRRNPKKLEVGDPVIIRKRYLEDYGFTKSPQFRIDAEVGKRFRICSVDLDATTIVAPKGHVVYKKGKA